MAKDPAFLFYSSDFLIGTFGMSDAQVGQYIRLMCLQHQKGHLSEQLIKNITGGAFDPDVMAKFEQDEEGLYYNVRLDEESKKRAKYAESRAKNRKGDAVSKSYDKHMSNICNSYDEHMVNENENVNINTISSTEKDSTKVDKPRFAPPALDDVKAYCIERKNTVDADRWYDHYTSNGWMVGRNKMKDWKAAVRKWENSEYDNKRSKQAQPIEYKEELPY